MLQDFFTAFNAYAAGHPSFLAKLKLLFWIKYWALMLLMAFFVFLIYRERGWRRKAPAPKDQKAIQTFEA